jgi:hypothetical protein
LNARPRFPVLILLILDDFQPMGVEDLHPAALRRRSVSTSPISVIAFLRIPCRSFDRARNVRLHSRKWL